MQEVGDVGRMRQMGGMFWHPAGMEAFCGGYPGVSSQAPQPPAKFCQPSGLPLSCANRMRAAYLALPPPLAFTGIGCMLMRIEPDSASGRILGAVKNQTSKINNGNVLWLSIIIMFLI